MKITILPVELLTLIVAEVLSRQDLVHLRMTCKRFNEVVLLRQKQERSKLFTTLSERTNLNSTVNWEIRNMIRALPSPQSAIRSFLVGFLPSEQEALDLLHGMAWTHHSVDLEAFVLEVLYGYLRRESFLQDRGAVLRLQELYAASDRKSLLRQLRRDADEYRLSREVLSDSSP